MTLEIKDSNYQELLQGEKPVVIDFWAPWCGPCKAIGPIVEELAAEYEGRVVIGKCNVDENDEVTAAFGIRNIPTLIFFKGGKQVAKQVGSVPKKTLEAQIEELL